MNTIYQVIYETPEAIFELMLSVTAKDSAHAITQMPSEGALALAKALRIKHNGDMDAVWAELDQLAIKLLGYPLSQKYKGAKFDF